MSINDKPYIIRVAELIYSKISEIKKNEPNYSNIDAIERFIGTDIYEEISSGKFHDNWFKELANSNFIDKETEKKYQKKLLNF
tara:strand:- start:219 stop:467 length:249 start_codon:yes stop_codon:yes gene_type:complete